MNNTPSKENFKRPNRQTEFIKEVFIKRLTTLFVMTLSFSFALATLIQMIFNIRYEVIILLSIVLIFFVVNTTRFSKWLYLSLRGENVYYKSTLLIHSAFAVINILCYLFIPNIVYSWIFLLAKFLKFIIPGCSDLLSILSFHGLLLLTTLISVSSVKWIVIEEKDAPKIKTLKTEDEKGEAKN